MKLQKKLEIIQKTLGVSQTKLADRLGVSFVAFNNWWTGKSVPRPGAMAAIEELFLEVTGQKVISDDRLLAKKSALQKRAAAHPSIIKTILEQKDIQDRLMVKLTYNSNSIEGSTLTEPDTAAILFDGAVLPNRTLNEHLEAKNHQTALLHLLDRLSQGGEISEELVLKLHGMLMNGIQPDAGAYRRHAVRLLGVNLATANFLKIPALIPPLMGEASAASDDVIALCSRIHSRFEQIHPFSDGNGRIGRLLLCGMLLRANVAPAIIHQEQKRLYYTYLYKAQTVGDHSQLEDFLCDAVEDGFDIMERMDE